MHIDDTHWEEQRWKTLNCFSTPLWLSSVKPVDYTKFENFCFNVRPFERFRLSDHREFDELLPIIQQRVSDICHNINPEFNFVIGAAWINNSVEWKNNPGTTFTGNIFIKSTESDFLCIKQESPHRHYSFNPMGSALFQNHIDIRAGMNKMTIFPSWLEYRFSTSNVVALTYNIHQV